MFAARYRAEQRSMAYTACLQSVTVENKDIDSFL